MGGEGKQAQGRRGQTGDKTQGQDTHVSRPSVTSQAKGHRTTCVCSCHKRDTEEARLIPSCYRPGQEQGLHREAPRPGDPLHPRGASPPLSGQDGKET